jgi:hypothetical protein
MSLIHFKFSIKIILFCLYTDSAAGISGSTVDDRYGLFGESMYGGMIKVDNCCSGVVLYVNIKKEAIEATLFFLNPTLLAYLPAMFLNKKAIGLYVHFHDRQCVIGNRPAFFFVRLLYV